MKVQSTLPEEPFFVHVAALLNLIIILVLISLTTEKTGVTRGLEIRLPKTQYVLAAMPHMATLSVSGGNEPVFYLNDQRLPNIVHLESALDKLKSDLDIRQENARMLVVLRLDSSVSTGLQMQLINMIMNKGMVCGLAADPL